MTTAGTHIGSKMQHVADISAAPATYTASVGSVLFGLTTSEWQAIGVLGGLILGALTYLTSVYFKKKHLELARNHQENK